MRSNGVDCGALPYALGYMCMHICHQIRKYQKTGVMFQDFVSKTYAHSRQPHTHTYTHAICLVATIIAEHSLAGMDMVRFCALSDGRIVFHRLNSVARDRMQSTTHPRCMCTWCGRPFYQWPGIVELVVLSITCPRLNTQ